MLQYNINDNQIIGSNGKVIFGNEVCAYSWCKMETKLSDLAKVENEEAFRIIGEHLVTVHGKDEAAMESNYRRMAYKYIQCRSMWLTGGNSEAECDLSKAVCSIGKKCINFHCTGGSLMRMKETGWLNEMVVVHQEEYHGFIYSKLSEKDKEKVFGKNVDKMLGNANVVIDAYIKAVNEELLDRHVAKLEEQCKSGVDLIELVEEQEEMVFDWSLEVGDDGFIASRDITDSIEELAHKELETLLVSEELCPEVLAFEGLTPKKIQRIYIQKIGSKVGLKLGRKWKKLRLTTEEKKWRKWLIKQLCTWIVRGALQ